MKAVVLNEIGGPEKLMFVTDAPEPALGECDVKIAAWAASINPVDWKMRSGDAPLFHVTLPTILGFDVSGVVVAIGSKVTSIASGDRVMALAKSTYAEFVVSPAHDVAPIPASANLQDAASLPLAVATGDQLVNLACSVQSGQRVIVTGALGSVGRCAVHAAKMLGAVVIAGVRSHSLDEAKSLGVSEVLALDDELAVSRLAMVDAVVDTVGGEAAARLISKIQKGGAFGSALPIPDEAAKIPGLRSSRILAKPDAGRLKLFGTEWAKGNLLLPIGLRLPLEQASEAQRQAEKGGVGKVLLTMPS